MGRLLVVVSGVGTFWAHLRPTSPTGERRRYEARDEKEYDFRQGKRNYHQDSFRKDADPVRIDEDIPGGFAIRFTRLAVGTARR
jgi:hypothetical protein